VESKSRFRHKLRHCHKCPSQYAYLAIRAIWCCADKPWRFLGPCSDLHFRAALRVSYPMSGLHEDNINWKDYGNSGQRQHVSIHHRQRLPLRRLPYLKRNLIGRCTISTKMLEINEIKQFVTLAAVTWISVVVTVSKFISPSNQVHFEC
jgi:hypothetical protein